MSKPLFLLLISLSAILCCTSSVSALSDDSLAFKRMEHLQHGINTSLWFAQSPGNYSVERLRSFTTSDDIALIHQLGFDHIRLSIDADPLLPWLRNPEGTTPFVTELDRVVKTMLDQHLAVIIDIHPESSYKAQLLRGTDGVEHFAGLWRALAKHFSSIDPELVFFQIMNEPEQDDPYRWQGIESFVAEQIRQSAPNHTIIVAGAHWSGLEDLMMLEPIALPNIIYTFHDYEPFPFTHQGATWTSSQVLPLRAVPYPSTPEAIQPNINQEPTLAGQFWLEQYGLNRWDAQRVEATLAFAEVVGFASRTRLLRRVRRTARLRGPSDACAMAARYANRLRKTQNRLGHVGLSGELRRCDQERRQNRSRSRDRKSSRIKGAITGDRCPGVDATIRIRTQRKSFSHSCLFSSMS